MVRGYTKRESLSLYPSSFALSTVGLGFEDTSVDKVFDNTYLNGDKLNTQQKKSPNTGNERKEEDTVVLLGAHKSRVFLLFLRKNQLVSM